MKVYAQKQNQPQQQSSPNITRSSVRPLATSHAVHPLMHLQRTIGNQAVLRLFHATQVSSADSSPAVQRKCAACESGQEVCSECAGGKTHVQRMRTTTTDMTPVMERKIGTPREEKGESSQIKEEMVKRPTQSVKIVFPQCSTEYGAYARLCYAGTRNWWLREEIEEITKDKDRCSDLPIKYTKNPVQSDVDSPCFLDKILNPNGPPENIAPCKTITKQTIYLGPTEAEVDKYKYENKQVVQVTADKDSNPKSGKVITTSAGEDNQCDWTASS